uniref:Uncharacterized protein n=1 Tax=Homalodisca liturata TaxID=320908 RepID=A0A1B6K5G6_9HEMI
MRTSLLYVICLACLVATGKSCMVGGVWRYGSPYYDDYDYGPRGRSRTGLGNTGYGNTGFVSYGVGLGGLGILLSLLFHPHFPNNHRPPPPREVHHHHHYFHHEGGGYDYKYGRDPPNWGAYRRPPSGSSGSSSGPSDKGSHSFSNFFKNMFYR